MDDRTKILNLLARYVRATDEQDGDALAALFTPTGELRTFSRTGRGAYTPVGDAVVGREAIRELVASWPASTLYMHLTTDHLVELDGDQATLSAQFVVMELVAGSPGRAPQPGEAFSILGTVAPHMAGYYHSRLQRSRGRWELTSHRILHSLPLGGA